MIDNLQPHRGKFEHHPGRRHECQPPDVGSSGADLSSGQRLPTGTVWKCLVHDDYRGEFCGKRWIVHFDELMNLGWRRRRLPWRPRFGVEHPPTERRPQPTEGGPTD